MTPSGCEGDEAEEESGEGGGVGHGLECNVAESTTTLTIPALPLNMKR